MCELSSMEWSEEEKCAWEVLLKCVISSWSIVLSIAKYFDYTYVEAIAFRLKMICVVLKAMRQRNSNSIRTTTTTTIVNQFIIIRLADNNLLEKDFSVDGFSSALYPLRNFRVLHRDA